MGYGHLFCLFHVDGYGLLVALPYCAQTGASYNKGISALLDLLVLGVICMVYKQRLFSAVAPSVSELKLLK